MAFRLMALRSGIIVSMLLSAASARAECIWLTAKAIKAEREIELVVTGTVVDVARTAEAG